MLKTRNFTQRILRRIVRRPRTVVAADLCPPTADPWSHPAVIRMSLDQLADLPFSRSSTPDGKA